MDNLYKDLIQHLCTFLSIKDALNLKMVSKHFHKNVIILTVHMYSCAIDKNKIPIVCDINCLKLTTKVLMHVYDKIKEEFYSKSFILVSAALWSSLKETNNIRPRSFLATTILTEKRVTYKKRERVEIFHIKSKIEIILAKYIEKELRYIQAEVWKFPFASETSLQYMKENKLVLKCRSGQIFHNTVNALKNLLDVFGIER
jgi:hypothetical protein